MAVAADLLLENDGDMMFAATAPVATGDLLGAPPRGGRDLPKRLPPNVEVIDSQKVELWNFLTHTPDNHACISLPHTHCMLTLSMHRHTTTSPHHIT